MPSSRRSANARALELALVACFPLGCGPAPPPPVACVRAGEHAKPARSGTTSVEPAGLVPPRPWIVECPGLDALWPAAPALSLKETALAEGERCRSAQYVGSLTEIGGAQLLERLAALGHIVDPRALTPASPRAGLHLVFETAGRRIVLSESATDLSTRDWKPPALAPITEILVCVTGAPALDRRTLAERFPELAPALPVLDLPGVVLGLVSHKIDRAGWVEAEVTLFLDDKAQTATSRWLVDHGVARPHPTIPHALDAVDRRLSFVIYPPSPTPGAYSIHAQHQTR